MKTLEELLEIAKIAKQRANEAESGVVMVDPEQDHRFEFLKNWVISNRHDETHSHGDGIARFQSEFDADFFCYSLQNITVLADAVIDLITQLKDAQERLAECETVVKFYGDENKMHDSCYDGHGSLVGYMPDEEDFVRIDGKRTKHFGKTARAYLTKWGVK